MVRFNKYTSVLIIVLFFSSLSYAQTEIDSRFKTSLSFDPGWLTENTRTTQLQAYIAFKPKSERIELRVDGFYFLNAIGDRPRFTINHQLFAGAFYKFSDNQLQPYLGFQPGIAYSQSSEFESLNETTGETSAKKTINPIGSFAGGVDFFAEKLFFCFIETRYIFGKHKSDTYPVFLDEFRVSFGLGFHF